VINAPTQISFASAVATQRMPQVLARTERVLPCSSRARQLLGNQVGP
jgi:hypothetical protein